MIFLPEHHTFALSTNIEMKKYDKNKYLDSNGNNGDKTQKEIEELRKKLLKQKSTLEKILKKLQNKKNDYEN